MCAVFILTGGMSCHSVPTAHGKAQASTPITAGIIRSLREGYIAARITQRLADQYSQITRLAAGCPTAANKNV